MKILLLTHENEPHRYSNTGRIVLDFLGDKVQRIFWKRTEPNKMLLECISKESVALLYPSPESQLISQDSSYDHYLVLDGTWQETKKMYNQSPYLKSLPTVKVAIDKKSHYKLRRNQRASGLCTAEIVMELLKHEGFSELAQGLEDKSRLLGVIA